MTTDELRNRLIALGDGPIVVETLDEMITAVIFGTDWDLEEARALFLRNFSTDLPK